MNIPGVRWEESTTNTGFNPNEIPDPPLLHFNHTPQTNTAKHFIKSVFYTGKFGLFNTSVGFKTVSWSQYWDLVRANKSYSRGTEVAITYQKVVGVSETEETKFGATLGVPGADSSSLSAELNVTITNEKQIVLTEEIRIPAQPHDFAYAKWQLVNQFQYSVFVHFPGIPLLVPPTIINENPILTVPLDIFKDQYDPLLAS